MFTFPYQFELITIHLVEVNQLDKNWLNQLKAGETLPLETLLQLHGENCVRQLMRRGVKDRQEAKDFFLDALLILRERIIDGRLEKCDAPDGYLYQTARNLFLTSRKKQAKAQQKQGDLLRYFYEYQSEFNHLIIEEEHSEAEAQLQGRLTNILRAFQQLGENCQQILKLFYIENKRMDAIAQRMNLKNAQTAKTTKSRCMKKWQAFLADKPIV